MAFTPMLPRSPAADAEGKPARALLQIRNFRTAAVRGTLWLSVMRRSGREFALTHVHMLVVMHIAAEDSKWSRIYSAWAKMYLQHGYCCAQFALKSCQCTGDS